MRNKDNLYLKEESFMKKIVFYIPAILFAILYGWLAISFGISSISSIIFPWISSFLVSGFLLNKGKALGGVIGMLPGIHLIYMSTKDSGQVINIEFPMGIIILIFYVFCCVYVFYKEKKISN